MEKVMQRIQESFKNAEILQELSGEQTAKTNAVVAPLTVLLGPSEVTAHEAKATLGRVWATLDELQDDSHEILKAIRDAKRQVEKGMDYAEEAIDTEY